MRIEKADKSTGKGWLLGPWNSTLDVSVGFANAGIDEPHLHERTTEVYLVACGAAEIRVEAQTIILNERDVIVVEPGEAHTFLSSSPDYFHFVLHVPCLKDEDVTADKVLVSRARLAL